MSLTRIVSGGQTGVDRAALDAALAVEFPCGGWCPPGRLAEDGRIPDRYPVIELVRGHYRQRTIQNILDSDGTLILYFGRLDGGTEQTVLHCIKKQRAYQLIDAVEVSIPRSVELVTSFVAENGISLLNVAGPRLSKAPHAHSYGFGVVIRLLHNLGYTAQHGAPADDPTSHV